MQDNKALFGNHSNKKVYSNNGYIRQKELHKFGFIKKYKHMRFRGIAYSPSKIKRIFWCMQKQFYF